MTAIKFAKVVGLLIRRNVHGTNPGHGMVRTAEGKTETPRTGRKTSELRKRLQYSPRRFGHA